MRRERFRILYSREFFERYLLENSAHFEFSESEGVIVDGRRGARDIGEELETLKAW
jgi:hypothetical protein